MRKITILILSFLGVFGFAQLNNLNQFENKKADSVFTKDLHFSVNKDLNLSTKNFLQKNNYFKKEVDYFGTNNLFETEAEKLKIQLEKSTLQNIIEGYVNAILNNTTNNKQ